MLYPVTEPVAKGWLDVGDGNRIYWEEAGNPSGVPALILHGGPGSGSSPSLRGFFDPARYRIISFDQRNCGQSTPHASAEGVDLSVNTTAHLIADIEQLRAHFGVDRWVVYGQSWGTTLGLAYGEAHRASVSAMVFAGVTTTSHREIDWLYRGIAPQYPQAWVAFRSRVPALVADEDILAAYNDLLFDPDPMVREDAATAFHAWDWITVVADPTIPWPERWQDPAYRLARARIVTHYFRNLGFLADGQLLADGHRLAGIPGVLIQGRLDLQSPTQTAEAVAAAWPGSELIVIDDAGHSSGDAGMPEAIVTALDRFAR